MSDSASPLIIQQELGGELEGLDANPPSNGWGEYPLDSVFVRSEVRTVGEVVTRISNQRYIMDPNFQRDFVWDVDKQSKLIESCLMRIPLPVFYVAEAKDGRVIVVDGLQRLTTFFRYKTDKFKLTGLGSEDSPHPLDGSHFSDLTLNLQERIDDTQLTMYILDAKAPERARLDIFERVNSGVPLTRQQMRNALYQGPATEWLRQAAESSLFKKVTGGSLSSKTMRDREVINRFCAFRLLGWERYAGGDMDTFLGQSLDALNSLSAEAQTDLRERFDWSLKVNEALFGVHAFRRSLAAFAQETYRSILNVALFDVFSVLFAKTSVGFDKLAVTEAIGELFRNGDFLDAITHSTNSRLQVQQRFRIAHSVLKDFLE